MAAAAGGTSAEGAARVLLQRYQPFASLQGEYHHFGPADGGSAGGGGGEMTEAVVLRTPVSWGGLVEELFLDNSLFRFFSWMLRTTGARCAHLRRCSSSRGVPMPKRVDVDLGWMGMFILPPNLLFLKECTG
jgi:hypothetical protein